MNLWFERAAMVALRDASYVDGYRIALTFSDGEAGIVDLADVVALLPAAAALRDHQVFKRFTLDEWPTLVWPNGFDLSPEMLYERATGKRLSWLHEPPVDTTGHSLNA
ncbi:MAG: DUF2442 domain-containing protein [Azonexus sp.]